MLVKNNKVYFWNIRLYFGCYKREYKEGFN